MEIRHGQYAIACTDVRTARWLYGLGVVNAETLCDFDAVRLPPLQLLNIVERKGLKAPGLSAKNESWPVPVIHCDSPAGAAGRTVLNANLNYQKVIVLLKK